MTSQPEPRPLPITLYDSYLKQDFTIDPDKTATKDTIKMYSCGPTIYSYQHIGNMRAAWFPTVFRDLTKLAGWNVELVLNITDVGHLSGDNDGNADTGEDRMEKTSKKESKTAKQIVDFYLDDYNKQTQALNIELPQGFYQPKATEYINEQMILALDLLQNDKAYLLEDGIYFDSSKNVEAMNFVQSLAGIPKNEGSNEFTGRDIENTIKNPGDFALWKFVDENALQKWRFADFPETLIYIDRITNDKITSLKNGDVLIAKWGCPGWHSECVAMICGILASRKYEPNSFSFAEFTNPKSEPKPYIIDLHSGGIEHIQLHHKNEILQSESLGFHLSKNWTHWQHVLVDGKKMGKSLGNSYLVTGDEQITGFKSLTQSGFDPIAYRLMLFEHHYLQPLDFTWEKLTQCQARLFNLRKEKAKIQSFFQQSNDQNYEKSSYQLQLNQILNHGLNNLDLPSLVNAYQELLLEVANQIKSEKKLDNSKYFTLLRLDEDLLHFNLWGINPSVEIQNLAQDRFKAKQDKNYQLADELRKEVAKSGWQIDDYAWGYGIWWNPILKN